MAGKSVPKRMDPFLREKIQEILRDQAADEPNRPNRFAWMQEELAELIRDELGDQQPQSTDAGHHAEKFVIEADDVGQLRALLLDGIRAKAELDRLVRNVSQAANGDQPAKILEHFLPKSVELDISDSVEMVMALELLSPAT